MWRRLITLFISSFIIWQLNFGQVPESKKVSVLNFGQFEPYLHQKNDTVYLVNFWATWCAPCRQEIPAIEKIAEKYQNEKFRILLVSLDMPKQLQSRLIPFINSHQIKSDVILLDDPNQNSWIDKVDPGWSGEIPFTLIYGKDFKSSYSKSFTYNELDSIVKLKLNAR